MSKPRTDGRTVIRIPARVAAHVLSSDAAHTVNVDPDAEVLARLIGWTEPRKDGSRHVPLSDLQCLVLLDYAEALADSASGGGSGRDDMGGLADLNAARALIRALTA